jgi:hypothetical protein
MSDMTHPPGLPWLVSWAYRLDPSLKWLAWLQLGISLLVPICIATLAGVIFGRTTARLSLLASSFYFPFIDYAGLFLAEIYMMLLIPLVLLLYVLANRARKRVWQIVIAVLAGLGMTAATAFKLVALPAVAGFVALYWLFFDDSRIRSDATPDSGRTFSGASRRERLIAFLRSRKTMVLLVFSLATLPGMAALSVQCTLVSRGKFCLVSNKGSADFLLGHYGRIRTIRWESPDGMVFQFGSPSNTQRNYTEDRTVPFSLTDGPKNSREAWKWIRANPTEALLLSFEHVYDLLGGSFPWPGIWGDHWHEVETSQIAFMYLLFIPSIVLAVEALRARGLRGLLRGPELLVLSPIFGVMLAVFIATGECRYRLPYDCVFIILAMEFYRRFRSTASSQTGTIVPLSKVAPEEMDMAISGRR